MWRKSISFRPPTMNGCRSPISPAWRKAISPPSPGRAMASTLYAGGSFRDETAGTGWCAGATRARVPARLHLQFGRYGPRSCSPMVNRASSRSAPCPRSPFSRTSSRSWSCSRRSPAWAAARRASIPSVTMAVDVRFCARCRRPAPGAVRHDDARTEGHDGHRRRSHRSRHDKPQARELERPARRPSSRARILPLDPHETSFSVGDCTRQEVHRAGNSLVCPPLQRRGEFRLAHRRCLALRWGINFAQEGKVIVAALGDGTIRWFRAEDGKELLALFVHNKDQRWIVWTPTGYYAASPGGEDLIGWNINRGDDDGARLLPGLAPARHLLPAGHRAASPEDARCGQAMTDANAEAGREDERTTGKLTPRHPSRRDRTGHGQQRDQDRHLAGAGLLSRPLAERRADRRHRRPDRWPSARRPRGHRHSR